MPIDFFIAVQDAATLASVDVKAAAARLGFELSLPSGFRWDRWDTDELAVLQGHETGAAMDLEVSTDHADRFPELFGPGGAAAGMTVWLTFYPRGRIAEAFCLVVGAAVSLSASGLVNHPDLGDLTIDEMARLARENLTATDDNRPYFQELYRARFPGPPRDWMIRIPS